MATVEIEPRQLLSAEAYTSGEWFAREREALFGRVWTFAGMTGDIEAPGDYLCLEAGRYAIVVLRDGEGRLRAFHNLCRHRGSRLLEGSGNAGSVIRCFYHNWTYDLAGALRGVPQEKEQFPGLDKSCLGLRPAALATWRNLVFVHPDADAGPFDDWLAGFSAKLGPHDPEALVEVARVRYRVRANWKIIIENFIDGYHFFYLHPVSLGDGDFTRQRWWPAGRHWMFRRPLKPGISHDKLTLPVVAGVDAAYGAGAYILFPNLALFETATSWLTFHVEPVAPDHSIVEIRTRAMPEALDRLAGAPVADGVVPDYVISAEGAYVYERLPDETVHPIGSDNVMAEDIFACEAVQQGMSSPAFEVGPMSKYESALTFFQQQVLDYVPADGVPD